MKLRETNGSGEALTMGWDEAQAALQTGNYEVVPDDEPRGPDQPAAQSPSPGTPPAGASEHSHDDLDKMSRADLDVRALERGLDPTSFSNRAHVIAALREPQRP